jgi:hypothetical protein
MCLTSSAVFSITKLTIYIYTQGTNRQKQERQKNKRKKVKEALKQSTNSYKIYCGIEKIKCAVFEKSKRI